MKIEAGIEAAPIGATTPPHAWKTRMYAGPSYEGGVSYSADVFRGQTLLCRLVYAGKHREPAQAHAALAARALDWIASYEARPAAAPQRTG